MSFAFVRCVLWPYLTYFYCRDALDVLADDPQIHSPFLVKLFMGGLLTLSVMQAVWLFQIVERMCCGRAEILGFLLPFKRRPPAVQRCKNHRRRSSSRRTTSRRYVEIKALLKPKKA